MKIERLSCNGCGSTLNFEPGIRFVECPYCGGQSQMTSQGEVEEEIFYDAIVPNRFDRMSFNSSALDYLMDGDDTPDNLLLEFKVSDELRAFYIPFTRYEVRYDGGMTCDAGKEVIHYVTVKRGNQYVREKRTDIEWQPFERNIKGRVVLDLCIGGNIREDFVSALQDVTTSQRLEKNKPEYLSNHGFYPLYETPEPYQLFNDRLYPKLNEHVGSVAHQQTPSIFRNLTWSFDHEFNSTVPFLAPIWLMSYEYGQDKYQLMMFGGSGDVFGDRPVDQDRIAWMEKHTQSGYISVGLGLLAWACAYFSHTGSIMFWLGLLLAGVGYGGNEVIKKKIMETSYTLRRAIRSSVDDPSVSVSAAMQEASTQYGKLRHITELLPKIHLGAAGAIVLLTLLLHFTLPLFGGGSQVSANEEAAPIEQVAQAQNAATAAPAVEETQDAATAADAVAAQAANYQLDGEQASNFVLDLINKTGSNGYAGNNAEALVNDYYADTVNYFGRSYDKNAIIKDKSNYQNRWPTRSYAVDMNSLDYSCDANNVQCSVSGNMDFNVQSEERNAVSAGVARFSYGVQNINGSLKIVSEQADVIQR